MTFRKPSLTIMIIIIVVYLSVCDYHDIVTFFCVSVEIGACACVYLVCPAPMLHARAINIRYSYHTDSYVFAKLGGRGSLEPGHDCKRLWLQQG